MTSADQRLAEHAATSAQLRATDIGVTVMAVCFVGLRFLARMKRAAGLGWDDYLMLTAMLLHFVNLALNLMMIDNGLGIDASQLDIEKVTMIAKLIYGDEPTYVVVLALVKVAILVMYCRIFPLRGFKIGAWIISVITVIWSLLFIFICIFQCNPIARAWNPTIPGTCMYLRGIFIGNAVPNIVTDAAILAMPMHQVWKLHARLAQRITLCGIFLLGCFVIFASIYRFVTILKLDQNNLSLTLTKPTTWSHIEICAAIVSACLPTLRPIVMICIHKLGVTTNSTSRQSGNVGFKEKLRNTLITIAGEDDEDDNNGGGGTHGGKKPRQERDKFQNLDDIDEESRSWPASKRDAVNDSDNDEVPLTTIKVQTDLKMKESRRQEGDEDLGQFKVGKNW
ncbi:hypothetical protein FQN54_001461 [Arachnomyces sp. PD_36]|nr:hypothetical protein FQN54_001461 [Arachnomyces sp. PD_36]